MGARPVGRREAFRRGAAVEARAVQESLGRVVGRSDEVEPATRLVHGGDVGDVEVTGRHDLHALAVARDAIDVPPPVALAHPGELAPAAEPAEVVHDVHPRAVPLHQHGSYRAARGVGEHRSEEHTSELQSLAYLVCRLLLEKKKKKTHTDAQSTKRTYHKVLLKI